MRYIDIEKNTTEPDSFSQWKKCNGGASWNDFSQKSPEHKRELKEQLITEQLGMCCYCELMLNDSHIEHLKPQSIYQQEMFVYGNLLASCNSNDSCGHKKGKWYEPEMVSPLHKDCEQHFTYTLDGRIIPSDKEDTRASETIEHLRLNCPKLKDRRRSIIKALENGGSGPEPDYLNDILGKILTKGNDWPFGFYTVLLFLAKLYSIPTLSGRV